jgi:hypothetical protein
MRDKNLTYSQFNIQLTKQLKGKLDFHWFLRKPVIVTPTLLENYYFNYPLDYRLLRTLSIVQWYFSEFYHYRIFLDLKEKSYSHLNEKQIIEINILLSSKDNCLKYLYETERYTGNEIFGNILMNDLKDLKRSLKIKRKSVKVIKPQRRRGYNDHGSKRPDEKWLPKFDFTFTEQQLQKEKKLFQRQQIINRILLILEDFDYD